MLMRVPRPLSFRNVENLFVSVFMVVAGLILAGIASRVVVSRITALAQGTNIPPFILGLTILSIGTDLPEIANSIIASVAQHGDMNAGDSIGSTVTQVTLVLGLLPLMAGSFHVGRRPVVLAGSATVVALLIGVFLLSDGHLSRTDGTILVASWIVGSAAIWRFSPPSSKAIVADTSGSKAAHLAVAILGLAAVGAGAVAALKGFIDVSVQFGLPEYLITFFAGSIGTSLPELFVDFTALRQGTSDLAVGDLFGSSFVDSTLSIGIGPIVAATPVSAGLVLRGGLTAAAALILVTLLFSRIRTHDWRSGLILLLIYAATYPILLGTVF
jgi:cation:H+ antiporter